MGKGSNTTTSTSSGTSTTSPDSNAYQAYLALLNRAQGVAATPYQGYTGEEVAPVNQQQTAGIGTINQAAGRIANTGPLTASDIKQYQDPYTQSVIEATQHDFDVQNQRANSTVTGNAAAQGALGGDRVAVAQALTQEAQNRVQAPVIAGLRSAGYQSAVNTAENQQRFGLQAGQALQGAGQSQIGAGTLQQQTQQAQDTQARADYYQQQGYPFQVAQWLAAIDTGVGSQMGGTSTSNQTGTTQGPTPNAWSQVFGGGLALASMFLNRGGRISGVGRRGFAGGGSPYGSDQTWVPQAGLSMGRGAPAPPQTHAPDAPKQQQSGLSKDQLKGLGVLGTDIKNWWQTGEPDVSMADVMSAPGITADDIGFRLGGRVKRFADGGLADDDAPAMFEDRFGAAFPNRKVPMAGIGASAPAFDDVVNPGDPIVVDPKADEEWRSRVDRDNGRKIVEAATSQNAPVPESLATNDNQPGVGPVAAINRAVKASPTAEEEPSEALAYGSDKAPSRAVAPSAGVGAAPSGGEDSSFLGKLGIHMTPELRQGLLQAGLAMMATTRGGPGSFLGSLGEAGMAGLGAYSQSQQNARKQALEDLRLKTEMEDRSLKNASSPLIRGPNGEMVVNPAWVNMKQKEAEVTQKEKYMPAGTVVTPEGAIHPLVLEGTSGVVKDAVTGKPPTAEDKIAPKGAEKQATLSDEDAAAIARYTVATGDDSRQRSLGFNPQNKAKVQSFITREMADKNVSDAEMAKRRQEFAAEGISKNAGARTRATREENLNMVLKAANAAIPAALEESEKVQRYTGYVPLDRIIQHGQVVTNDPNLVTFGMANLQLAEHWARAMNPMGVMRESDRDLALHFLDTAFSKNTYKAAVMQLQKQITRERDAIREGKTGPAESNAKPGDVTEGKPKPTQADIDYAKAHPEVRQKFVDKFGVEP